MPVVSSHAYSDGGCGEEAILYGSVGIAELVSFGNLVYRFPVIRF